MLRIHFRLTSSHLSWSHAGHLNLVILYAGMGWLVEASASEHRIGATVLDPSPSISDCPGRGLLPKVTDCALMLRELNLPPTSKEMEMWEARADVCRECRDARFNPPRRWWPSCSSPELCSAGCGLLSSSRIWCLFQVSCSEGSAGTPWAQQVSVGPFFASHSMSKLTESNFSFSASFSTGKHLKGSTCPLSAQVCTLYCQERAFQ